MLSLTTARILADSGTERLPCSSALWKSRYQHPREWLSSGKIWTIFKVRSPNPPALSTRAGCLIVLSGGGGARLAGQLGTGDVGTGNVHWHVSASVSPSQTGMGGTSQSFLIIQDPSCDILVLCLVSKSLFYVSSRCYVSSKYGGVVTKVFSLFLAPLFTGWPARRAVVCSRWYLKEWRQVCR